jgi:hypothetical protein
MDVLGKREMTLFGRDCCRIDGFKSDTRAAAVGAQHFSEDVAQLRREWFVIMAMLLVTSYGQARRFCSYFGRSAAFIAAGRFRSPLLALMIDPQFK